MRATSPSPPYVVIKVDYSTENDSPAPELELCPITLPNISFPIVRILMSLGYSENSMQRLSSVENRQVEGGTMEAYDLWYKGTPSGVQIFTELLKSRTVLSPGRTPTHKSDEENLDDHITGFHLTSIVPYELQPCKTWKTKYWLWMEGAVLSTKQLRTYRYSIDCTD